MRSSSSICIRDTVYVWKRYLSINTITNVDPVSYPNLVKWMDRMKQLPYYHETNGIGAEMVPKFIFAALERDSKIKN